MKRVDTGILHPYAAMMVYHRTKNIPAMTGEAIRMMIVVPIFADFDLTVNAIWSCVYGATHDIAEGIQ